MRTSHYLYFKRVNDCPHLCCYHYNVSAVVSSSGLRKLLVDSSNLQRISNQTLYLIYGDRLFPVLFSMSMDILFCSYLALCSYCDNSEMDNNI